MANIALICAIKFHKIDSSVDTPSMNTEIIDCQQHTLGNKPNILFRKTFKRYWSLVCTKI